MKPNTIICKSCGVEIEISEALRHQVEVQILDSERKKHNAEMDELRKSMETDKAKLKEEISKELAKQQAIEFEDAQKQLSEKDEQIEAYKKAELSLRQEKRAIEQREKDLELETQRKMDEERQKIEEATLKRASEAHQLKEKEQNKVIEDLKKSLADAQRRAAQGSQQLQGEVLELEIEELLANNFPNDDILPVAKGVKGGDVKQIVRSPKGFDCGSILWESKQTKAWSDGWIAKLKEDQRAEKANIGALISITPPKDMKQPIEFRDGVWVCGRELLVPLAMLLRKALLDVGLQKAVAENKGGKAEGLYTYVTSHEFVQQLEVIIETYSDMHQQVQKERTAYEKMWAQRENQARRMLSATANIVGSMQGQLGQSAMPRIKGLELLEAGDVDGETA